MVNLLVTAAAFDMWERWHDFATRCEGKGTDEMDRQCMVRGQAMHTLTVCAPFLPFLIVVCVFPYPDIGAKIRFLDFWISINNPSIGAFPCDCPQHVHTTFLIIILWGPIFKTS